MDYKYEEVNCAVCKEKDEHFITDKGQFGLPVNFVLCKNCGLGYLNPRWDRASYFKFYSTEYDKYYRSELSENFKLVANENNVIYNRLKNWKLLPDNVDKILDIGSGAGQNLADFGAFYKKAKLFAIEPSSESDKYLKQIGATVISRDVDSNWQEQNGEFDFIIMRHVLEHFLDPLEVLQKVRASLSDEGVLYLAVPDNLHPRWKIETNWVRTVHTYYFNKYSLHNIFALAGLEILNLKDKGDSHNPGEVFLVAKKSVNEISPAFSSEHFEAQRQVLESRLKKENAPFSKILTHLKKMVKS